MPSSSGAFHPQAFDTADGKIGAERNWEKKVTYYVSDNTSSDWKIFEVRSLAIVDTAARPRIRNMIRDATIAGLLPEQLFVVCLGDIVEVASAAFSGTLIDSEKPTAHLYLPNAAQAAEGAWQQETQGHNGPWIANPTIAQVEQSDPTSQHEDDGDKITCVPARKGQLKAPQL